MIQLPENWADYLQISPNNNALFLHLYNGSGQFFTYYSRLDPAIPLQKTLEDLKEKLLEQVISATAYIIENDMSRIDVEPQNQDWGPAPIVGIDVMSLTQYEKMRAVKSAEVPKADPIPGPEGLPAVE